MSMSKLIFLSSSLASVGGNHAEPAPLQPQYSRSRSAAALDRLRFLKRPDASSSSPNIAAMSVAATQQNSLIPSDSSNLNTIPDPRATSPMSNGTRTPSGDHNHHPDLSNEVATLSSKLINAINQQTNLDDALQETRQELDLARDRIKVLEVAARHHDQAIAQGVLVRKVDSTKIEEGLKSTIAEERLRRSSAERDKKGMEQELETLTSQLFEEANGMVASARQAREAAERRAEQLRSKLRESESLLVSHQDELRDLKGVLQQVKSEPNDAPPSATTPATPWSGSHDRAMFRNFEFPPHKRSAASLTSLQPPESPLHFSNLIHPVVRTDVQAYEDFIALLRSNKGGSPPGRASSGNFVGLNVIGIGSKEPSSQSTIVSSQSTSQPGPLNSSSRSASSHNTPNPSGSYSPNLSNESSHTSTSDSATLKETKFYKRALVEDIEPTLRLDTAPGLSWLARRTALNSMASGKAIVEPFPSKHAFHSPAFSCSLCGESRTNEEHVRRYRFKTSDVDDAPRYPLCDYCLARLRAVCDFTAFLRSAKSGHWKNETTEDCRGAWEECVRLREKMFWARLGGGVVPVGGSATQSPMDTSFPPQTSKSLPERMVEYDTELPLTSHTKSKPSVTLDQSGATSAGEEPPATSNHPEPTPAMDGAPLTAPDFDEQDDVSGPQSLAGVTLGSLQDSSVTRKSADSASSATPGQAPEPEPNEQTEPDLSTAAPESEPGESRESSFQEENLDRMVEQLAGSQPQSSAHPESPTVVTPPAQTPRNSIPSPSHPYSRPRGSSSSPAPRKGNLVAHFASRFQDSDGTTIASGASSPTESRKGCQEKASGSSAGRRGSSVRPGSSSKDGPRDITAEMSPVRMPGSFG